MSTHLSSRVGSRTTVALILAATSALTSVSGAQAQGAVHAAPTSPKPTVVLVHGAWADSGAWDGVVERLQQDGYVVDTLATPLRSLAGDAAYVRAFLQTVPGPVVLVGHSYGGAVVTNAATDQPNVVALVYVDAFAPAAGETVLGLATNKPGSALANPDPTQVFTLVPTGNELDLYVLPTLFPGAFANDLPAKRAAVLASTQRPVTLSALATPSGAPAWASIPSWYFLGTRDRVIPPAEQLVMAQRARATIVQEPTSHLPMVSDPGDVTRVIKMAADA